MNNHTRIINPSVISGVDLCRAALAEAASTKEARTAARREQLEAEIKAEREKIAEALAELLHLRLPTPVPAEADLFTPEALNEA